MVFCNLVSSIIVNVADEFVISCEIDSESIPLEWVLVPPVRTGDVQ